jgi:hypothetical protein
VQTVTQCDPFLRRIDHEDSHAARQSRREKVAIIAPTFVSLMTAVAWLTGCVAPQPAATPAAMPSTAPAAEMTKSLTPLLQAQLVRMAALSFYQMFQRWPKDAAELQTAVDQVTAPIISLSDHLDRTNDRVTNASTRFSKSTGFPDLRGIQVRNVTPQPDGEIVVEFTSPDAPDPKPIKLSPSATTQPLTIDIDPEVIKTLMRQSVERALAKRVEPRPQQP